jgi:cation-dependent mannose-6-phosphate receptor
MIVRREQASQPFFRGRKLVLNYTNGSPCPSSCGQSPSLRGRNEDESYAAEEHGYDHQASRTKSTIMSFLCDRDSPTSQAALSFVGTVDSCTYFFEVRSAAACGGVALASEGGLGPAGVFGVM